MNFNELNFTVEDELILIELNTADKRNTLRTSLLAELTEAFNRVEQEKSAKLLILTGAGNTFSIGADIAEINALKPEEVDDFVRRGQRVMQKLIGLEIPTLAAVNGLAFGGGFELALACDMRWAHKRALFSFPECKLKLIPAWGGIQLGKLHISPSRHAELLLSGDRLNAQTAYDIGLVSQVFEGREFIASVKEAARKFLANELHVLKGLKKLIKEQHSLEVGFSEARPVFYELWSHPGRKLTETVEVKDETHTH